MNYISDITTRFLVSLREFYAREVDREVPGSSMLREVVQRLDEAGKDFVLPDRTVVPVLVELTGVMDMGTTAPLAAVLENFKELEPNLQWTQNPNYNADRLGEHFMENYGYANIIGPGGLLEIEGLMIGALLLGPGTYYPKHFHPALEAYYPLCGEAYWSKDEEEEQQIPAGSNIFHGSNVIHAMRTADKPLLALYSWLGEIDVRAELKVA